MPIPDFVKGKTLAAIAAGAVVLVAAVFALGIYADHTLVPKLLSAGHSFPLAMQQELDALNPFREKPETSVKVVSEESQVIDAVKKASPAVVSIVATADVPRMENCLQTIPGFGGMQFQVPGVCQNGTQQQEVSAGSGYLVSSDGYILTNRHVVDNGSGTTYTVILNDDAHKGEKVVAKVLARDSGNDIAVLKIDKAGLPFLSFGDSTKLQVGQTAIAIGYALGQFENTVSKGVVSGLSRSISAGDGFGTSEQLIGVIQTDAAINPGNSGGPLLDIDGNVIGMNVAEASGSQSIGFALPADEVKSVFESVRDTGKIEQPWLGVRLLPITADVQSQLGLSYDYGDIVVRGQNATDVAVVPGSPADKAGIVENDVILAWNGTKIDDQNPLPNLVAKAKVGDVVQLKISHKGVEKTISVTLTARPQ
jgi:serine protease Do